MTFEFRLQLSVFYFLFSATHTGFLIFCLPADEATAKSVTKYSPTDSEKQTAVVCKDNELFFFDKAFALSKTIHVSQDPARAGVARYVFSVCDTDNMNSTIQALKGYVHKNLKKNKRPSSHHQVPLQVRQRKPPKMLSYWKLRRSLQAYNH